MARRKKAWNGIPEDWGKGFYRDVPISKYVRLARERQIRDLKKSLEDPNYPYYFDLKASDRIIDYAKLCVLFDGDMNGKPFEPPDWVEWDILRPLFGWKRKDNGFRRFRSCDVFVARKNIKSTLAGIVSGYMLIADREHGAQIYCAATKEDQADIVWDATKQLIENSPELADEIVTNKKLVLCPDLRSKLKRLGKDSKRHDGLNAHCASIDEFHAHPTSDIVNVLKSSMGTKRQPLLFLISSFGYGEGTPCQRKEHFDKQLLEGIIENDRHLAFLAVPDRSEEFVATLSGKAKEGDRDYLTPEQMIEEAYKANPNLGVSLGIEDFKAAMLDAAQQPDYRPEFLCKQMNIWVRSFKQWISMSDYSKCDGRIDWEKFIGKRCFASLDLGKKLDLSALALAFIDDDEEIELDTNGLLTKMPRVCLQMHYWISEEGMRARSKTDKVSYEHWVEAGYIKTTPGAETRWDYIRKDINILREKFEFVELTLDPAHAAGIEQPLLDDGLVVVHHPQTLKAMNLPCSTYESLILEHRLGHDNNPVQRWMSSNAVIFTSADELIKVVKNKSMDRVDGVTAASMAVGRLIINPVPEFIYNTRGIFAM